MATRISILSLFVGLVTISGQVGDLTALDTSDITAQTQETLAKIDDLLAGDTVRSALQYECGCVRLER
jgi:enamine deaminase RidA (YjgF/YER057c/UK114 family)